MACYSYINIFNQFHVFSLACGLTVVEQGLAFSIKFTFDNFKASFNS